MGIVHINMNFKYMVKYSLKYASEAATYGVESLPPAYACAFALL